MLKYIKSFLTSLAQNTLVALLVGVVTVPVLVSYFWGTLDALVDFVNSPTPVWLIAVVFASTLLYIRYYSKKSLKSIAPCQTEDYLIEDSGFKWKVADFKNGHISIDPLPFCVEHEYEYVETPGKQLMCREALNSECSSKIMDIEELTFLSKMAKSKAQKLSKIYETRQ